MQRHIGRRTTGALLAGTVVLGSAVALPQGANAASPAASSAGTSLVTAAAYRGAEHVFMVSNVVTALGKYGKGSTAERAALSVLHANNVALATLLTANAPSKEYVLQSLLTTRDQDEIAYAGASLGVHQKKKGSLAAQGQALQSLGASESAIGKALAALYPDSGATADTKTLKLVDTADEQALEAQSRTGVDRFPKILLASTTLAALTTSISADEAVVGKIPGDLLDGNSLARIAGAIVATQHVYMVGQFVATALAAGNGSGQAKAAEYWTQVNSADVVKVLSAESLNPALSLATWRGHINGYRLYVAYTQTGHKGDLAQAQQWLSGYENTISDEAASKFPGLSAGEVKVGIVEHVTGTEQVIRDLKAGNPRVFAEAEMGAQHLVDVFSGFAEHATITKLQTSKLQESSHLAKL